MTPTYDYQPVVAGDRHLLADWIAADHWPFNVNANPTAEQVRQWFDEGAFQSDTTTSFWMFHGDERIGLLKFDDLDDGSPAVDLRLRSDARGRGHGAEALRWMTAHCFETWPRFQRMEGCTREDNVAMRRLFKKIGYVKEAYVRAAWPVTGEAPKAAIRYGMLRTDWERGETTPVVWDDD